MLGYGGDIADPTTAGSPHFARANFVGFVRGFRKWGSESLEEESSDLGLSKEGHNVFRSLVVSAPPLKKMRASQSINYPKVMENTTKDFI